MRSNIYSRWFLIDQDSNRIFIQEISTSNHLSLILSFIIFLILLGINFPAQMKISVFYFARLNRNFDSPELLAEFRQQVKF